MLDPRRAPDPHFRPLGAKTKPFNTHDLASGPDCIGSQRISMPLSALRPVASNAYYPCLRDLAKQPDAPPCINIYHDLNLVASLFNVLLMCINENYLKKLSHPLNKYWI